MESGPLPDAPRLIESNDAIIVCLSLSLSLSLSPFFLLFLLLLLLRLIESMHFD